MGDLRRVALWGLAAAAALTVAVYAGSTAVGRDRAQLALAELHEMLAPSGAVPPRVLSAAEGRRLTEIVRMLTADRERLVARIATLEHSVDDITGSIAEVRKAQQEARPPEPATPPAETAAPQVAPPPTTAPREDLTSSITPPAASASEEPAPPRRRQDPVRP
jgi:hypothetical protein